MGRLLPSLGDSMPMHQHDGRTGKVNPRPCCTWPLSTTLPVTSTRLSARRISCRAPSSAKKTMASARGADSVCRCTTRLHPLPSTQMGVRQHHQAKLGMLTDAVEEAADKRLRNSRKPLARHCMMPDMHTSLVLESIARWCCMPYVRTAFFSGRRHEQASVKRPQRMPGTHDNTDFPRVRTSIDEDEGRARLEDAGHLCKVLLRLGACGCEAIERHHGVNAASALRRRPASVSPSARGAGVSSLLHLLASSGESSQLLPPSAAYLEGEV